MTLTEEEEERSNLQHHLHFNHLFPKIPTQHFSLQSSPYLCTNIAQKWLTYSLPPQFIHSQLFHSRLESLSSFSESLTHFFSESLEVLLSSLPSLIFLSWFLSLCFLLRVIWIRFSFPVFLLFLLLLFYLPKYERFFLLVILHPGNTNYSLQSVRRNDTHTWHLSSSFTSSFPFFSFLSFILCSSSSLNLLSLSFSILSVQEWIL